MQAEVNPKTETQKVGSWTMIVGGAAVEIEGSKAIAFLSVFSGFGRVVSVLGVFNDAAYATTLDQFVGSIAMDKIAVSKPAARQLAAPRNTQPGKFGLLSYQSPADWSEQKFADGVVFKPLDLPADELLWVSIMPPLQFSGTIEQALKKSYEEAAKSYNSTLMNFAFEGNYKTTKAQTSFCGWKYSP